MLQHRVLRNFRPQQEDLGVVAKREDPCIGDVFRQQVARPTNFLQSPCRYVTPADAMYETYVNGRITWGVQLEQTKEAALFKGYLRWRGASSGKQTSCGPKLRGSYFPNHLFNTRQTELLEDLGQHRHVYLSRRKEGSMAGNKTSYTIAIGDNHGGLTAGQVNITDDPILRRQRIISWLSPLNFWQKQDNVFSDAHPGTGQWFLKSNSFTRWLDGDTENLWCYGAPGSGKTVIASITVNDLRQRFFVNEEVGVAAVYCEWKRQDILSPVNLLASVWSQLVSNKPLTKEVHNLYDNHTKFRTMATSQEVVSILKREVERYSSVYIIVDALDELAEAEGCATVLIDALSRLAAAPLRKMRILATSRTEHSLLPRADVIQITATQDDIKRFVKNKILEGISNSHGLSEQARSDKALRESLVSAISKQASKRFLLARLFVQNLKYKTNLRDLRNASQNLPSTINEQYKVTWSRIEGQHPDHRRLALRILSWLSHAMGPLKVQELRHALAVNQGDRAMDIESLEAEDLFQVCCHGLVSIELDTQTIRLVHYTAQQFLDGIRKSLFPDAQAQILRTCLTYLSFDEFKRGRCAFESFEDHVNKVANGKRIAKRRFLPFRLLEFPFLRYAASNWGRHAAGEVGFSQQQEILAFLEDPMLLESAAQVQDSDLLYPWPWSDEGAGVIKKNLPLFVAGSFGLHDITAVLLTGRGEFDVNAQYGSNERTVLHQAVETGNVCLTRVLLDAGADARLREGRSVTEHSVLYKAIAQGHNAIVEILLSHGQDELIEPGDIYCATFCENEAAIRSMIESSPKGSERLRQILLHAASLGRTSVIELTLRLGADLEAKDDNGQTALFLAVRHGRIEAVELLLKAMASTTTRDASGIAVSSSEVFAERFRFIRHHGLQYAGIPDAGGRPCSMEEPMVLVDWFMKTLDVWLEDCSPKELEESPEFKDFLYEDDNQSEIVKKLIGHGGDVNEQDSEGESILHRVVYITAERARALLEGSKGRLIIDAVDKKGRTPLHYAAAMDKAETMELLLEHGANIAVKDQFQASTLHFSV
ncbi:MAG: hypothetical protein Q9184_003678, partial [Pyrenodesmia sp. 2 TL-2023]